MGATCPPVQWVPGLSWGKEQPGRDVDPSAPSTAVVKKGWSYTSASPMGHTACTERQCLYSTAILLLPLWTVRPVQSLSACKVQLYLYSPCWPYGLYRASISVQGCTFPYISINPLNAELNPICQFLSLLRSHHIPHVSRIRLKMYNWLMTFSEIIATWSVAHMHLTHTNFWGRIACNIEAEYKCSNHSSY